MSKTGIWCVDQNSDPKFRHFHTRMAACQSYRAEVASEKASENPTKENHWDAFSYHNGAAMKHAHNASRFDHEYHRAKHQYHEAKRLHHLAEWKKLP